VEFILGSSKTLQRDKKEKEVYIPKVGIRKQLPGGHG
jgi:hypothetical protein